MRKNSYWRFIGILGEDKVCLKAELLKGKREGRRKAEREGKGVRERKGKERRKDDEEGGETKFVKRKRKRGTS